MSDEFEKEVAMYEAERNRAWHSWFAARGNVSPSNENTRIFDGGFRMAWELCRAQQPVGVQSVEAALQEWLDWCNEHNEEPEAKSGARIAIEALAQQPAARPPKPTECMNGCPDRQVCDHCQWPPGPDQQPAAVDGAIDKARFERAPCYLCGYNGPGYYQPDTHPCAAKYHTALAARQQGGAE